MRVFIVIIIIVLIYYFITKKIGLSKTLNPFLKTKTPYTIDDKYNSDIVAKQLEIDKLLEKINTKGYDKLSKKEKDRLDKLSK